MPSTMSVAGWLGRHSLALLPFLGAPSLQPSFPSPVVWTMELKEGEGK